MSEHTEFVALALQEGANRRELCRRYGISPRTAYKWRARAQGGQDLAERSRRPHTAPQRTPPALEAAVLTVRHEHPAWGARKVRAYLLRKGHRLLPSPSTITAILARHGLLDQGPTAHPHPWQRFEHPAPNALWQMDFKGHFPLTDGSRCHPLTVLDDHSRFSVGLEACANEQGATVHQRLTAIFSHYGLPVRMVMDNGSPWGDDQDHPHTPLTVWLLQLGIAVSHGRPYHPQTQGKDERFPKTLKAEVLQGQAFPDLAHCQEAFDR